MYSYNELVARDKASLDIFWLKDDSLADSDNLPPPEIIAGLLGTGRIGQVRVRGSTSFEVSPESRFRSAENFAVSDGVLTGVLRYDVV